MAAKQKTRVIWMSFAAPSTHFENYKGTKMLRYHILELHTRAEMVSNLKRLTLLADYSSCFDLVTKITSVRSMDHPGLEKYRDRLL